MIVIFECKMASQYYHIILDIESIFTLNNYTLFDNVKNM